MPNILIIDDDLFIREVLTEHAQQVGCDSSAVSMLSEGMKLLDRTSFDLVFLDVRLPDGNGLDALPRIRESSSSPEVIIITGIGDADGAEMAINSGAWDYIQKPFSRQEIRLHMLRILEYRKKTGQKKQTVSLKRDAIIGSSPQISACLDQVAQCADSDTNVHITGETGTGKELFARAIHENSTRADSCFVVVDCAALPDKLVESILFGHQKGAFTGADRAQAGLISEAHDGTLFLDEVGELPLSAQKSFLRVLQERTYRPIGGKKEISSRFRLISATNRDLDDMVKTGHFRQDLLYRLRTFPVQLPSLRERKKDLDELMLHYTYKICKKYEIEVKGMTPELMTALEIYHWPGNIREFINTLESAILADPENPLLFPMHLPPHIRLKSVQKAMDRKKENTAPPSDASLCIDNSASDENVSLSWPPPSLKEFRQSFVQKAEKQYLIYLMRRTEGSIQEVKRLSGLSQSRLYYLLKKYEITRE